MNRTNIDWDGANPKYLTDPSPEKLQIIVKPIRDRTSKRIGPPNYTVIRELPDGPSRRRALRMAEARKKGRHTTEEWNNVLRQHDYKCAHCGSSGPLTKDHIKSVSRGGSDAAQNLQPLCQPCNSRKRDR